MAKTTSIRKTITRKSPTTPAFDPATLPDQYALAVVGNCMMPAIDVTMYADNRRSRRAFPWMQ
jgi:hypothetical protein